MSKKGLVTVKLGTPAAAAVHADGAAGVADANGRKDWAYVKNADSAPADKINLYVGPAANEILQFQDLSSFWSLLTIDDFTAVSSLPFMHVYTKPQGDGQDASWYRSKLTLQIPSEATLVRPGERVCIWFGKHAPPSDQLDGARLIHLRASVVGPAVLPTDEIYMMPLSTDSSATSVGLCVETIGYQVKSHAPTCRMINMHLMA
jgi:hypothetical protein